MKAVLLILFVCMSFVLFSQQSSFDELISKIQEQEIKFPFPQKDTVITVGSIDISNNNPIITFLGDPVVKHISYKGSRESSRDLGLPGPNKTIYVDATNYNEYYRTIDVNTHLRFKLRFTVHNWVTPAATLTVNIGSKKGTVSNGATEVFVDDVREVVASVGCYLNDPVQITYSPYTTDTKDRFYFNINWHSVGAGIITLPVLPVKIIYAPIVDFKHTNTSSISTTNSQGYNLSFAVGTVNSNTTALPTSLTDLQSQINDMNNASKVMEAYPDPDVQAVGKAIGFIGGVLNAGIGSSSINLTVANSISNQHSFSITTSETEKMVAKSSNGGPGQGDVICFYTGIKLLWCAINGKMQLTILGFNSTLKTPTASQLIQGLNNLSGKSKGTKDPTWKIDASAIRSLIALDPFANPYGAKAQLDPTRFTIVRKLDGTPAAFQNGGTDVTAIVSHQVTQTDAQTQMEVTTKIEVDKPGFLSFLGIGETDERSMQSVFSKSSSSQVVVGQTVSNEFTLHGDGNRDHYYCEVYFDAIFGTFAYRDNANDLDHRQIIQSSPGPKSVKKTPQAGLK